MFEDLDYLEAPSKAAKAREASKPTFPCQSCGGTGVYQNPRVHQPKSHCFACKGTGCFKTSPFDRAKKKQAKIERDAKKLADIKSVFDADHPGFEQILRLQASWSNFAKELLGKYVSLGALTQGQVDAVLRTEAKAQATRAARDVERAEAQKAKTATVDLSDIHKMFDYARSNGLKRLQYRAEGLVISPAKSHSVNAGALYVKTRSGEYMGKVVGDKFLGSRDATKDTSLTLMKIAKNPLEVAKASGKTTGTCSCCGRELTDPVSIEMGIGPTCAEKWFGIVTLGNEHRQKSSRIKAEIKSIINEAVDQANEVVPQQLKASTAKYDYPVGLTDAQKKAFRAKARRA